MSRDPAGHVVERELLTLPVWDRLGRAAADGVARAVERCLPGPWGYKRLAWHECGDQRRWVAFFDWNGAEFALIPGGEVTLGYDRKAPFRPTPAQQESWDDTRAHYGLPPLARFLAESTTELRTVSLPPLLAEVAPAERDGGAGDGFRRPTADEWEHLSAAGSRTLWRWGDDCPTDGYPSDYRRGTAFDRHRAANAFGLTFPHDEYLAEGVTAGPGDRVVPRSGAGGSMTCGGAGSLIAWLMLATWVDQTKLAADCDGDAGVVRRVLPLPSGALA